LECLNCRTVSIEQFAQQHAKERARRKAARAKVVALVGLLEEAGWPGAEWTTPITRGWLRRRPLASPRPYYRVGRFLWNYTERTDDRRHPRVKRILTSTAVEAEGKYRAIGLGAGSPRDVHDQNIDLAVAERLEAIAARQGLRLPPGSW